MLDDELKEEISVAVGNGASKEDIVSLTKEYQKKKRRANRFKGVKFRVRGWTIVIGAVAPE